MINFDISKRGTLYNISLVALLVLILLLLVILLSQVDFIKHQVALFCID